MILFQPTRPLRGATRRSPAIHGAPKISTHAPLAGRDKQLGYGPRRTKYFNPRAPCGARRKTREKTKPKEEHFNPRAPCGARRWRGTDNCLRCEFQPTRPLRGATIMYRRPTFLTGFQPTRPLRGATAVLSISILRIRYFNPRAPCGARRNFVTTSKSAAKFQPTRPLRGATLWALRHGAVEHFNPRAPCGARLCSEDGIRRMRISTHAPLAGRDKKLSTVGFDTLQFQPTRPLRGATGSISTYRQGHWNFNPRAPCGARLSPPC